MPEENTPTTTQSEAVAQQQAGSALILRCLEDGQIQWRMWAEHWRTSPAYGCDQPEIHPVHQKVIENFDKAKLELAKLIERQQLSECCNSPLVYEGGEVHCMNCCRVPNASDQRPRL